MHRQPVRLTCAGHRSLRVDERDPRPPVGRTGAGAAAATGRAHGRRDGGGGFLQVLTRPRAAGGLRAHSRRREAAGPFDGGAAHASALSRRRARGDRKSTRLNSSHLVISYAVFCLKKKKKIQRKIRYYSVIIED